MPTALRETPPQGKENWKAGAWEGVGGWEGGRAASGPAGEGGGLPLCAPVCAYVCEKIVWLLCRWCWAHSRLLGCWCLPLVCACMACVCAKPVVGCALMGTLQCQCVQMMVVTWWLWMEGTDRVANQAAVCVPRVCVLCVLLLALVVLSVCRIFNLASWPAPRL